MRSVAGSNPLLSGRARHSVRAVCAWQSWRAEDCPALPTRWPPLARTILCELDSLGRSRFSRPVHDGHASGDQKNPVATPRHVLQRRTPVPDGRLHSRFARERNYGMQMIRHKQAQAAAPDESLVVEFHSRQYGLASVCAAQLVFAFRHAVDRDKEPTAVDHPLWNGVRQPFADTHRHARA
jgi:hypothetical protein